MKIIKLIPFILLIIGTSGLLVIELFAIPGLRYLILTFAGLNIIGLTILLLRHKKV